MDEPVHDVRLLGPVRLLRAGQPVGLARSPARLLALLGMRGPLSRPVVADHLWPGVGAERAHGNLRSSIWRLSGRAPGLIRSDRDTLVLAVGVRVDAIEATALARRLVEDRSRRAPDFADWAMLQRELLPEEDDEWAVIDRERFRQLRLHALEALCLRLCSEGRHAEAIEAAHCAVAAEPLRESAHHCLIRAHLEEGNQLEAINVYRRFSRILLAEVGLHPSPALRRLLPHGKTADLGEVSLV